MAQFSLSLINHRGTTVLTDYDTMAGKTAGLTFDEHLNLNVDGSTLDFSMLKYLYEGSKKVVNTPTISITYGSIIKCLHNGHRYDFAVTDISYQFLPQNLQLTFSAQDYFQFETSKLGIGYTITGDTTDPDYFGAQPIDAWAQKIVRDNNLRWGYIPINQANREWINLSLTSEQKKTTFTVDFNKDGSEYWKNIESEYTLNQWVSFECSDSTAYNALKQLASENGLMIVVDYNTQNFWFAPQQNVVFNGYYFNPNNNLQQFSIKGSAQNLVTVLNITGPKDLNDQEITLVPKFPVDVVQWILSKDWENTKYYPGLYNAHTEDSTFLREIQYTPWLENKLIDFSFFTDNNLLMSTEAQTIQDILYNKLRIINAHLIVEQNDYLTHYGEDYQINTQAIIDAEALNAGLYSDVEQIATLMQASDHAVCFATRNENNELWAYWPEQYTLYGDVVDQQGQVTEVEINAESLGSDGPFHGKLYSPEVSGEVLVDAVAQLPSDFTSPIVIQKDAQSQFEWCLFQQIGSNLQYQGHSTTSGWYLNENVRSSISSTFDIIVPTWCTELQIDFNYAGPSKGVRLRYNRSGSTVSVSALSYTTNGWSSTFIPILPGPQHWENLGWLSYTNNVVHCQLESSYVLTDYDVILRSIKDYTINYVGNVCSCIPSIQNNQLILTYSKPTTYDLNVIAGGIKTVINKTITQESITMPDLNSWTDIIVSYLQPGAGAVKHIQILEPITLRARYDNLVSNDLTVQLLNEKLNGSYVFNQLAAAIAYTKELSSDIRDTHVTIIVDKLNELCGSRDNYIQTFANNCYHLLQLWDYGASAHGSLVSHGDLSIGAAALKFQDVAVLSTGGEIINANNPYYSGSDEKFTNDDIIWFKQKLALADDALLLRTAVIDYIYKINTNITEYWTNCYAAAMGLGVYWPKEWNNSKWLCRYPSLIRSEKQLVQLLSPLVPQNWDNYDYSSLVPNLVLMPCMTTPTNTEIINPETADYNLGLVTGVVQVVLSGQIEFWYQGHFITNVDINDNYYLTSNTSKDTRAQVSIQGNTYEVKVTLLYSGTQLSAKVTASSGFHGQISIQHTSADTTALTPVYQIYKTYQFRDYNEVVYHNIQFLTNDYLTSAQVADNTQLRPILIPQPSNLNFTNGSYNTIYYYHNGITDALRLYSTTHSIKQDYYNARLDYTQIPAQILALPLQNNADFSASNYEANPCLYTLYSLAARTLYDTSKYYTALHDHDEIWRGLYQDYPGIFRESTYVNDTTTSSQELYVAAKAQLDSLSKPSYEYSLTGMDIYMHDSDYVPTRLKLGEQIRIDYQDPDQITDTLNAAIREPLYVTGISHALRNDGDYQFTVTTRTATDTMVQRFAQLLSFGR